MFGSSQTLQLGSGFGATQGMSQSQSPEKRGRQEDKQTCIPASVRLLLDAQRAAEKESTELQLHGAEVANITLLGVVEGLVQQATMLEFTLNDGSGRVKVRHYKNDSIQKDEKDSLVAGKYASVVGSLRSSPTVHVSALSLRPVTSADEVSYHMIEVAHTALTMKSGGTIAPVKTEFPAKVFASQPTTVAAAPPPAAAPAVATPAAAPAAKPADVRSSVLEVLKSEGENRPEGVPLTVMLDRLKSFPAAEVRTALEGLVADGEAFTTIDDDHFSPI